MLKAIALLYGLGLIFAFLGLYVALTYDKYLGTGLILVAAALFIIPMTRQRY